uniref:FERM domain-containing protein 8 n=1 Tax=Myxine glutinosa TaxID=7769 RepID=UPI00358EAFE9
MAEEEEEVTLARQGSESSLSMRAGLELCIYVADEDPMPLLVEHGVNITAAELLAYLHETLELGSESRDAFALWLSSPSLDVQLKPRHEPFRLGRQWRELLRRFAPSVKDGVDDEEPALVYRRNVFYPKSLEMELQDESALCLLWREARTRLMQGHYPCDREVAFTLATIDCRLSLGPFDPDKHTLDDVRALLPPPVCSSGWAQLSRFVLGLEKPEQQVFDAFRKLEQEGQEKSQVEWFHRYLSLCHEFPFYGCAFFPGAVERPTQGLLHLVGPVRKDVSVAISLERVCLLDRKKGHVILSLRHNELSWDYTAANADKEDEPVLWLEFDGSEDGRPVNKLLQVFSWQAELMSGMIQHCIELAQEETDCNTTPTACPSDCGELNSASTNKGEGVCVVNRLSESKETQRKPSRKRSVLSDRPELLSTIAYVEDGQELQPVKPRRSTSFFSRGLGHAHSRKGQSGNEETKQRGGTKVVYTPAESEEIEGTVRLSQ